jgi:hypothetical protein
MPHLADYFNNAGYDTAYIGKWHLATDKDFMCEKTAVPEERRGGYRYWRAADVLEFTSDGQGGVVFDEDGNIKVCGREACKALIRECEDRCPDIDFGDSETGMMNVENIKKMFAPA